MKEELHQIHARISIHHEFMKDCENQPSAILGLGAATSPISSITDPVIQEHNGKYMEGWHFHDRAAEINFLEF